MYCFFRFRFIFFLFVFISILSVYILPVVFRCFFVYFQRFQLIFFLSVSYLLRHHHHHTHHSLSRATTSSKIFLNRRVPIPTLYRRFRSFFWSPGSHRRQYREHRILLDQHLPTNTLPDPNRRVIIPTIYKSFRFSFRSQPNHLRPYKEHCILLGLHLLLLASFLPLPHLFPTSSLPPFIAGRGVRCWGRWRSKLKRVDCIWRC